MKKLLTTLLLSLALNAGAEPQKLSVEAVCDKATDVLNYLETKYEEVPIFVGKAYTGSRPSGVAILMANQNTKTWTNVLMTLDGSMACILASGQEYTVN
jgi:hypothetical protein